MIAGVSGAGRSSAADNLEDLGWFCFLCPNPYEMPLLFIRCLPHAPELTETPLFGMGPFSRSNSYDVRDAWLERIMLVPGGLQNVDGSSEAGRALANSEWAIQLCIGPTFFLIEPLL